MSTSLNGVADYLPKEAILQVNSAILKIRAVMVSRHELQFEGEKLTEEYIHLIKKLNLSTRLY